MSFLLADYRCPSCLTIHESLESRPAPEYRECPMCGGQAERIISGVHTKTTWCAPATRAKSDERPGPATMDTRAIADGMDASEWKAKRQKLWQDRERKQWKAKVG